MVKNKNGFTQHLTFEISRRRRVLAKRSELSAGFIPMIIIILIILAAVIWLVYTRVAQSRL